MMQDIGKALDEIMRSRQCSSIYAFLLLSENKKEGGKDGICKLQSKSTKETGRRLRNTRDF